MSDTAVKNTGIIGMRLDTKECFGVGWIIVNAGSSIFGVVKVRYNRGVFNERTRGDINLEQTNPFTVDEQIIVEMVKSTIIEEV